MKYTREEWIKRDKELYKLSKDYNDRVFYKAANKVLDVGIIVGLVLLVILIISVLLK